MYLLIPHCVAAKKSRTTEGDEGTKRFSWEVLCLLNLAAKRKQCKILFEYLFYYATNFLSGSLGFFSSLFSLSF